MVKLLLKRIICLSAVSAVVFACLPNSGPGKFARYVIELIKLLLILLPILELIR